MTDIIDMAALRRELSEDEGRRRVAYRDSLGFWTIGVGHKLPPYLKHYDKLTWDTAQIDGHLDSDIQAALFAIKSTRWFKALDTEPRRRALVNMRFNLGGHLDGFHTFLHFLGQTDWTSAAKDLDHTLWHKLVGRRAIRIQAQIIHG